MESRVFLPVLLLLLTLGSNSTKAQKDNEVLVLGFNGDGAQRISTWAQYGRAVRAAGDYTLCLRFNIWVFRLLTAVIYLLDQTDIDLDPISFEVYFEKIRTKYGGLARFYPLPGNLATNKWYHYCHVRDMTRGEGRVYLDGQLIVRESYAFQRDPYVRNIIVGQDEFQMKYSLSGKLSQINMWNSILPEEQILSIANCESNLEGDLIAWSGKWQLYEIKEERVPLESLCRSVSRGLVTVKVPFLRYPKAVYMCRGLGGAVPTPKTLAELKKVKKVFEGDQGCIRQWAGVSDAKEEGKWLDPFTQTVIPWSDIYFRKNNPDGNIYQNCLLMDAEGLEDTDCKKHSCAACFTVAGRTWTLRGICEEEERMYYLDLVPSPLSFRGYGEYAVQQGAGGVWAWSNIITNTTMATLSQEGIDLNYPVGRLTWNLQSAVCHQESGSRVLTLSACNTSQFTCSDGSCVDFAKRCDLKFDCDDKTDERYCDIINFPEDYRSKLPPRPASDSSLPIALDVTMDTLNIDTTTMLLSVSYNLRMTWFDNRLTFNNLKNLTRLNTVSLDQVAGLWRPHLGFINTDDIQNTAVDADAVTTVVKLDQTYAPDLSNPYEVEVYRGDTNPISSTRKYSTVYTCNFDLVLYPFDIQFCYMKLQILSASSEYLIFNSRDSSVEYLGPTLLVEYGVGRIDLRADNATQFAVARVRVELIRRYGYAMLNIYIPSLTLLVISYVTLFFRPSIFEVRVMTALTSLLVLATLFTQVSASLPKTSYFKMVDIWLLFCIVLIFLIILFHTVIDLHVDYVALPGQAKPGHVATWAQTLTGSAGGVRALKVRSADDGDGSGDEGRAGFFRRFLAKKDKFDLEFYIAASKITMLLIFAVFNLIYWGSLLRGSGLVYYL